MRLYLNLGKGKRRRRYDIAVCMDEKSRWGPKLIIGRFPYTVIEAWFAIVATRALLAPLQGFNPWASLSLKPTIGPHMGNGYVTPLCLGPFLKRFPLTDAARCLPKAVRACGFVYMLTLNRRGWESLLRCGLISTNTSPLRYGYCRTWVVVSF